MTRKGDGNLKQATKPKPALIRWVPKIEAAELVGLSVRQLERLAQRGYVQVETHARARGRGKMAVYNRRDLDAYNAGAPNIYAVPVAEKLPVSNEPAAGTALVKATKPTAPAAPDFLPAMAFMVDQLAAGRPVERPWLTLPEAVSYSGLPEAYLRRAARSGASFVLNVGSNVAPRWRFSREGLGRV